MRRRTSKSNRVGISLFHGRLSHLRLVCTDVAFLIPSHLTSPGCGSLCCSWALCHCDISRYICIMWINRKASPLPVLKSSDLGLDANQAPKPPRALLILICSSKHVRELPKRGTFRSSFSHVIRSEYFGSFSLDLMIMIYARVLDIWIQW